MRLPVPQIPLACLLAAGVPALGQITVMKIHDLRVGTLIPGEGAGTLTLDPDGKPTPEGGLAVAGPIRGAALLQLSGPPGQPFTVAFPEPRVLFSWHKDQMELHHFRAEGRRRGLVFDPKGHAELRVGATLNVPGRAGSGELPRIQVKIQVTCDGVEKAAWFHLEGRILRPLRVRAMDTLAFGRILTSDRTTEVTLDVDGRYSLSPDQPGLLLGKSGQPGRFELEGEPGEPVQFELPGPPQKVYLRGPGAPIELRNFTSSPAPRGLVLDGAGRGGLKVGATLVLPGGQPPGTYEGFYSVVFAYP